jgi:integrase
MDHPASTQPRSGADWQDTGLFFVRPDGQPWHPRTITARCDYLVTKAGLPPVRLHDLRHCAATYLRHGGADLKEVQEPSATLALPSPPTSTPPSSSNYNVSTPPPPT